MELNDWPRALQMFARFFLPRAIIKLKSLCTLYIFLPWFGLSRAVCTGSDVYMPLVGVLFNTINHKICQATSLRVKRG